MRKTNLIFRAAPIAALALLAACNSGPETVSSGDNDPDAANVAAAPPPPPMPPALKASKTYRCKDNSLVYIDFYADNLSADFRANRESPATRLVAPSAGAPMVAEGYSLTGDGGATITLTSPGKPSQSCKG